jgi:hypothetical protein
MTTATTITWWQADLAAHFLSVWADQARDLSDDERAGLKDVSAALTALTIHASAIVLPAATR